MRRRFLAMSAGAGALALAAACGSTRAATRPSTTQPRAPLTTSTVAPVSTTTTTAAPPTSAATTTTTVRHTTSTTTAPVAISHATVPPTTSAPPAAPAAPATAQRIVVDAGGYGQSTATFSAYEQRGGTWSRVFGPWSAWVGRNGVAPVGAKREGDGRTPSGRYGFSFFFGVYSDPGVHFPYRHITTSAIKWNDDSSSPNYNEWIDTNVSGVAAAGVNPETMYNTPSYDYGAVIAYNTSRTPGLGSAIFLHVSHNSSTAGCVALPMSELVSVLRWLQPGEHPTIAIGVGAPAPG